MTLKKVDETTSQVTVNPEMKMQSFGLNAWFGKKQALKDINLQIKPNAVTAIIGPSDAASPL